MICIAGAAISYYLTQYHGAALHCMLIFLRDQYRLLLP